MTGQEPAFPTTKVEIVSLLGTTEVHYPGVTIRQFYFAKVVEGLLASGQFGLDTTTDGLPPANDQLLDAALVLVDLMVKRG